MRHRPRLILATGSLLAAKSALLGMRALTLLLIAAFGRQSDLASASFALSLTEIGRWLADFGTETWTVRAIATAQDKSEEARTVSAALLIKAAGSIVVGLVTYWLCRLRFPEAGRALACSAVLLVITHQIAGLTVAYFQAKERIAALAPALVPCALTIGLVLLPLLTGRPALALPALAAGELCIAAVLVNTLQRQARFLAPRAVWPQARSLALACVPTAALGVTVGLYSRLDTLVLAGYSTTALAAYTVAQRLFQPAQIAVTAFGAVVYARSAAQIAADQPFARRLLKEEVPVILGSAIGCSVLTLAVGSWLIHSVYPQYLAALTPLAILSCIVPVLAFNSILTGILLGYGRFWTVLSVAVLDLGLTYLAMTRIPSLRGPSGTAISLLLGAIVNGAALSGALFRVARARAKVILQSRQTVTGTYPRNG